MKGAREHKVPLSDRLVEIIELADHLRPVGHEYVFPGKKALKPLSTMALETAMRRLGASQYTPHGMRSSFRDWCGDETDFARETAEMALAHKVKDATEASYRRRTALEKRRKLLQAWDDYLKSEKTTKLTLVAA